MRYIKVDDRTYETIERFAKEAGVNRDFFASGVIWSFVATWSSMLHERDFEGMQSFMDGLAICLGIVSINGHEGSPYPGQDVDVALRVHPFPASRMAGEASN